MQTRHPNRVLRAASAYLGSFLVTLSAAGAGQAQISNRFPIMEAYPDKIQQRLDAEERSLRQAIVTATSAEERVTVQYVLDTVRQWDPGDTLTVAFSGGSPELRAQIEAAAKEWSQYCNIKFDFRVNGKFREWSSADTKYQAQIRIAFLEGNDGGYWSALGRDSVAPEYYPPGKASMNFEGFPTDLPPDSATTVKHEFGHALGFWHEHQHPEERCDEQLRWNDDPGYVRTRNEFCEYIADAQNRKPGVYTVFRGPPNEWSAEKVDFAMRHISDADSHAYKIKAGPFDRKSIMKYYYPASLFIEGDQSRCYNEPNLEISAGDREGAASIYPKQSEAIKRVLAEKKRVLDILLQSKNLSPDLQHEFHAQRDSLPK